jgi:predicted nucleic acid-binding protein
MIVVDTNILAYLFFPNPHNVSVEKLRIRENDWSAPELWRSEFLNAATLYLRKGIVSMSQAIEAYEKANRFVLSYEMHSEYKEILLSIKNSDCSSYDCEFVVLAQKLNSKLLTYDKKILNSFPNIATKPEEFLAFEQ